jgi:C4-type Zn-finger protein
MTESEKEPEAKLCVALNAATRSESTARRSDFAKGRIVKLAFELRNLGYSETYLATLIGVPT